VSPLVVVAHPEPLEIEARPIEHEAVPPGALGLAYFYRGRLIARGIVAPDALEAIRLLLSAPVPVALAATEDEQGNIEARICLVLPVDPEELRRRAEEEEDEAREPWKASLPPLPPGIESGSGPEPGAASGRPHIALLPIGSAVRSARDRRHPDDIVADVREMLDNLLAGRGRDAVAKAIDDLLESI